MHRDYRDVSAATYMYSTYIHSSMLSPENRNLTGDKEDTGVAQPATACMQA